MISGLRGGVVLVPIAAAALLLAACGDSGSSAVDAKPDGVTVDSAADVTVDVGVPDAASDIPADGPVAGSSCATAEVIALASGRATVQGDKRSGSGHGLARCGTRALDATDLFYRFTPVAGTGYRITFRPGNNGGRFAVFDGQHNCDPSAVEAACGVRQAVFAPGGESRSITITATASGGDIYLVADGIDSNYDSYTFTFEIEEVTPTPGTTCKTAKALTLSSGKVTVSGDTSQALDEYPRLTCTSAGASAPSPESLSGGQDYYAWPTTANTLYRLTLTPVGRTVSQRLVVFTDPACTEASIAADCQSGGSKGIASGRNGFAATYPVPRAVYWKAASSGTAFVAVDSTSGFAGPYALSIEELTPPTNGSCANAAPITLTGGKGSVTGDTGFLITPDEHATLDCGAGALVGPQAYYKVDLEAGKTYDIELTADAAAGLTAYVFGSSCALGDIQSDCTSGGASGGVTATTATAPRTRSLLFKPPTTGSYTIAVDSDDLTNFGAFTLSVSEHAAPTNATCATASPLTLTAGKVSVQGSTRGASDEFATLNCLTAAASVQDGPQVYYSVQLTGGVSYLVGIEADLGAGGALTGYVFSDTCAPATIASDCSVGSGTGAYLNFVGPGRGASYVLFQPPTSATYKIAVDSTGAAANGRFTLSVEEYNGGTPSNDTCANAAQLTLSGGAASVTARKVGASDALSRCGAQNVSGSDLFYRFTPSAGKTYVVTFTPVGLGGRFGVFDGNHGCTQSAVETACGVNGSSFVSAGVAASKTITASGGDIYIVVDGLSPLYDTYDFTIDIKEK